MTVYEQAYRDHGDEAPWLLAWRGGEEMINPVTQRHVYGNDQRGRGAWRRWIAPSHTITGTATGWGWAPYVSGGVGAVTGLYGTWRAHRNSREAQILRGK
ncbi:hypothetical protein C5C30_02200 [Rathayibacter sp. AY2B5]|nr:hypothetical protein C5C30_02200 [Rathayibacter sp. AY2B5]